MEVIVKRLLVIMLILVALGVVSADIIKIKTDMVFFKENITLRNVILGFHLFSMRLRIFIITQPCEK